MATVTGSVVDLRGVAGVNSTLRFVYASAPAENGALIASGVSPTAKINSLGNFSVVLTMGDYVLKIDDNPNDVFRLSVPDDSNSYDVITLIVSEVTQSADAPAGGTWADASTTVTGGVRIASGGTGSPAIVYTQTQVDALLSATGGYSVATIAAARALTVAQMTLARVILVRGGAAAYDGNGGIYYFEAAGTAADNGASILRPSNYTTGGNLKKVM